MNFSAYQNTADNWLVDEQSHCPYDSKVKSICSASLSSTVMGLNMRQTYCGSENYDNCPIFLAKILRRR